VSGLTNQGWDLNVFDTVTFNQKHYGNGLNNLTATVADTTGLPCP